MKNEDYFCHPETFFGQPNIFHQALYVSILFTKVTILVADLKHDWEKFLSETSDTVLIRY